MSSDEKGILAYDLAGNWCEECGRAKMYRLWPGMPTGCKTCDEAITRHRCTRRPDLDPGQSWECPDCGTIWTAREEEETCGECAQGIGSMRKTWDSVPGDRIDTAPRHKPVSFAPFRDLLPRATVSRPGPFGSCHRTASGIMIHVKPDCRC